MTVKYLQNKNDRHKSVYRVNFNTMKYVLIKNDSDHGIVANVRGSFRIGGFAHEKHDHFFEVPSPFSG